MSLSIDKLKPVFLAALAKTTASERAAFLDEACADDATLRQGVEAMLRVHERDDTLLDRAAVEHLEPPPAGEGAAPAEDSLGFLEPPTRPDSLGRIGHYEVLEVLGRGGFGIVLRAFDDTLQRVVAVKVLAPQLAATSPARKRFLREARSSAMIRHENVVQVYAVEEQPLPYLVMEFIPGETLQKRLDRIGPLELVEVLRIGRQIAEGLTAAHAHGLIHRDIKPGNILIEDGPHECVKITDFGLARAADDASMTQSAVLAGTPMFMAPEQASGAALDCRADLFSLGSVLYTMCTGRPPFRASSTLAVLRRVAEDTPRPIPEIIPEVPQWLCDVITRLHAKKPEDRIATAKEVTDLMARGLAAMQHPGKTPALPEVAPVSTVATMPREGAIPVAAPVPHSHARRRWAAAMAVVLLLVTALAVTEFAGVTHLVRGRQTTPVDSIQPGGDPTPVPLAKQPALPPTFKNTIGMEFVIVTKGKSWLGGGGGKPGELEAVLPADFYLGKYAVTQGQWKAVMGQDNDPSHFSRNGGGQEKVKDIPDAELDQFPVEMVSWNDAQEFLKRLNELEQGGGYRLPTSAEWEYACRGGAISREESAFHFYFAQPTNDLSSEQANFNGNFPAGIPARGKNLERTCKVGSYRPNRLGLYDMHGNVWQWCDHDYGTGTPVFRGGGALGIGRDCVAAERRRIEEGGVAAKTNNLGFRVARIPSGAAPPEAKSPPPATQSLAD